VPRGATSCASPLFQDDVTLDAGKLSTVALLGGSAPPDGGTALGLIALTDDHETVADKARVRFLHAALGTTARAAAGTLAVRAVAGQVVTLAEALPPRGTAPASTTIPIDELGYATIPPLPPPDALAIAETSPEDAGDAGAATWQSASSDLGLGGGSLHTGFVLTGEGAPFEVLWCRDSTTVGDRTACDLVR
jgi:hypothetical protein